jgi:hypothetical protein
MKLKTSILLIGITAALTGCNEADRSQQTKTVGWFLDHREELAAQCVRRQSRRVREDAQLHQCE